MNQGKVNFIRFFTYFRKKIKVYSRVNGGRWRLMTLFEILVYFIVIVIPVKYRRRRPQWNSLRIPRGKHFTPVRWFPPTGQAAQEAFFAPSNASAYTLSANPKRFAYLRQFIPQFKHCQITNNTSCVANSSLPLIMGDLGSKATL